MDKIRNECIGGTVQVEQSGDKLGERGWDGLDLRRGGTAGTLVPTGDYWTNSVQAGGKGEDVLQSWVFPKWAFMLNADNKTAAARRVGALCVVTMATAYVCRSPSACIADLWVTFSLTESFRSSLAFWALRCITPSGFTCPHTHKHTRPVETCRPALSSGRPFSCEVAVYSSRTTALPATPFGASAVRAQLCVSMHD